MGKINKQWDNYPTSGLILTIFGRPLNYSTTGTENDIQLVVHQHKNITGKPEKVFSSSYSLPTL